MNINGENPRPISRRPGPDQLATHLEAYISNTASTLIA